MGKRPWEWQCPGSCVPWLFHSFHGFFSVLLLLPIWRPLTSKAGSVAGGSQPLTTALAPAGSVWQNWAQWWPGWDSRVTALPCSDRQGGDRGLVCPWAPSMPCHAMPAEQSVQDPSSAETPNTVISPSLRPRKPDALSPLHPSPAHSPPNLLLCSWHYNSSQQSPASKSSIPLGPLGSSPAREMGGDGGRSGSKSAFLTIKGQARSPGRRMGKGRQSYL